MNSGISSDQNCIAEAKTNSKLLKSNPIFWSALALVIFVAVAFRTYQLDLRPMHNDEGVNWHFIKGMERDGYYKYSHENYHGPSYFYLTAAFVKLFGDDQKGMRLSAVAAGVGLCFLLLALENAAGRKFILFATMFVALSPSLIFYSRYAIHESLFVLATVWVALAVFLWFSEGKPIHIYTGFAGLALLVATKETYVVNLAGLSVAIIALGRWSTIYRRLKEQKQHLIYGTTLFGLIVVTLYSGGLQWFDGIRELTIAVQQWIGRGQGDTGHFKRFLYYSNDVIAASELHLLLGFVAVLISSVVISYRNGIRACLGNEYSLGRYLAIWSLTTYVIYSFIPYKTPWLVINITAPLSLLLGYFVSIAIGSNSERVRFSGWLILIISIAIGLTKTLEFNFKTVASYNVPYAKPYGSGNPFSYVHTSDGMVELVSDIDNYSKTHANSRVLVGVNQYWPLPFYLKGRKSVGYIKTDKPQDYVNTYDILIVDKSVIWNQPNWSHKYYRLSDVQESQTYFRINPGHTK